MSVLRNRRSTSRLHVGNMVDWSCPLNRGLVSWWLCVPQLMAGQTWYDIAGQNNGSFVNNPLWTTDSRGPLGGSVNFVNASSQAVSIGNSGMAVSTACTIAAWVRPIAPLAGNGGICFLGNRTIKLDCLGNTTSDFYYEVNNGLNKSVYAANKIPTNSWSFLCGAWDDANLNGYVANQSSGFVNVGTTACTGTATSRSVLGQIGHDNLDANATRYFNGRIGSVWVFNRGLSASDVFDLYTESILGYPRTLNRIGRGYPSQQSTKFRRTLSALGTRTGSRQIAFGPEQ